VSVDVEGFLLKMMCREIVMDDSAWNVAGGRRRIPGYSDVCWGVIFMGCRFNVPKGEFGCIVKIDILFGGR